MNVIEAIRTRRSIRKYRTDPVSAGALEAVLDAARWAPSWANTQCCRLVVVEQPEIKVRIAEALSPSNPAFDAVRSAPVLIVACAEVGRSGFKKGEPATDKGDWFMFDVALAMQNLALAAHELGLGTVHVGLFDASKVENILQVPGGVWVVAMIPLGYPAEQPNGPGRKELGEIVFHEKYGKR